MHLIRDLEATRDETLACFALGEADLALTHAPGKWSVRFLLHHLADSETVLFDRIRRVVSEPRQVLWAFDQDAWAKGLDYSQVPLDLSRRVYEAVRNAMIYYAGRHYERHGHLEFVHSVTGVRTLRDEFEKVASHNVHHLSQIRTALATSPRRGVSLLAPGAISPAG
jgi:DinB family protein